MQDSPLEPEKTQPDISIVFDPDDAGRAAAIDAVLLVHSIFDDWGTVMLPGEPESMALAQAQREYSDRKAELHARLVLDLDTDKTEDDLDLLWERIHDLQGKTNLGETLYSTCHSADEYATKLNEQQPVTQASWRIDYKKIKEQVDLATYVSKHTILRQRGDKWMGKCPLPDHQDDTASFWVYPNRSWYCFGCRRGGDIFHFVKAMKVQAAFD